MLYWRDQFKELNNVTYLKHMSDISQVRVMILRTYVCSGHPCMLSNWKEEVTVTETEYQSWGIHPAFLSPFFPTKKRGGGRGKLPWQCISFFLSIIILGWWTSGWLQSCFDQPERAVPFDFSSFWFQNGKLPWLPVVWPLLSGECLFPFLKCFALRLWSFSFYHSFWISPVQRNLL